MSRRVVITGMGVTAPNGVGLKNFEQALRNGDSGIRKIPKLEELNFSCQVAGEPEIPLDIRQKYFTELELRSLNSSGILYGMIAGMDAWKDSGLPLCVQEPDWDSGIIFGTGILGVDKFREAIHLIDQGKTRRLGSTSVLQTMASGISAFLNTRLGCGNIVTTNSSACTTGTEAILLAFDRIRDGKAKRVLAGSCGESGPYVWGGFDAMRILPYKYNEIPQKASRPMSASASGFVPGSGAGALVLEELETALKRGARIYAEVLGGHINSGGQVGGGSMTAPNSAGVRRCIREAVSDAGILPESIDTINGHLTATGMDVAEVSAWKEELGFSREDFPYLNSLKGLTGHCLSGAGSMESVAAILQLSGGFVFGNRNSEDLHPEIEALVARDRIPVSAIQREVETVIKASFGFGDVNAVIIFKKYR